jgi:bifunctional non-homologous end joining protein LigD
MGGKANPKSSGEKHENWLLIKERDDEAVPGSDAALVDGNPLSVATGRSIEAIAADRDRIWDIERGEVPGDPPPPGKKPLAATRPRGARKRTMAEKLLPQLATLAEAAPDGDQWLHEIKYDGYRLLARIERGTVRLTTRNGLDWTDKFAASARALAALPVESALIDGEIVALAADGTTDFAVLQDAIARRDTSGLVFYAFDLVYQDGWDLTEAVLEDRKAALAALVPHPGDGAVRYSDHQVGRGTDFYRHVCGYDLEGIVAKRRDRPYRPGRGRDWLKIKCDNRDEFVVVGFTEPAGRRHGFGALLIGYYDTEGRLRYAGRVGTGFNDALLSAMRQRLDAIERPERPVALPKGVSTRGVRWTEPRLVAQVRYGGWTTDGVLRHPAFLGLCEDKNPEEAVVERRSAAADAGTPDGGAARPTRARNAAKSGAARGAVPDERAATDAIPAPRRDGTVDFAGVRLTNPDRVFYPEERITKLQLAEYYATVADWALPHLAQRALSMVRCPEGVAGQHFYQKHDMPGFSTVLGRIDIRDKSEVGTYLFIKDLAGLVGVVQMGVLEIHPWGSTVDKLETPDRITFDFDPDEGLPWEQVSAAAIEMREALAGIGLKSFAKTTGGKGLHVVVPVAPKLGWEAVKEFSKWVAERFAAAYPERFTTNMAKRARSGRIFIDYLRNGRGATAIGAYSARARRGAPVATPLFWDEVEQGVTPDAFTVATVPERLAALKSDPWAEMPKLRQSISARVRREVGI